jgi:serine protease Do
MKLAINSLATKSVMCLAVIASCVSSAKADGEIFNKTLKATTWVLAKSDGAISTGTGVLVDAEKKLVITNFHVIGEARTAVIFFPDFKDGKLIVDRDHYTDNVKKISVRGRVLAVDRKRDLALIELDKLPEGVAALPMAEAGITQGEDVQSIGNPGASGALWVFNSGTVRTVYQKQFRTGAGEHDFLVVETQSPVNSGDSGGPVVSDKGELVAIAQATSRKGSLISYNVDISEVKAFINSDWKQAPLPVVSVLDQAELKHKQVQEDLLEVSFTQKDKTEQSVFVAKDVEYFEQADVRRVWSLAASMKEVPSLEIQMKLLEQNSRTKLGSWTIEQNKDGEYLIVYVCKLDATATPRTLKSTMEYVARLTSLGKKDFGSATSATPVASKNTTANVLGSWLGE